MFIAKLHLTRLFCGYSTTGHPKFDTQIELTVGPSKIGILESFFGRLLVQTPKWTQETPRRAHPPAIERFFLFTRKSESISEDSYFKKKCLMLYICEYASMKGMFGYRM